MFLPFSLLKYRGCMSSKFVRQSLIAATIITVGTNVFGRIIGYAREAVIAGYFGTSSLFDTFLLAFTIPELITFIAFAALPPAFIPLKRNCCNDNEKQGKRLFVAGLITFAIIFGLIALVIYLLKAPIINLLAPRLSVGDYTLALKLISILAWFVFFRGMEAYFRAVLFDKKHFVVPAFSPMVANLLVLAFILFGYNTLNIEALAYGWLAASIALFLINGMYVCYLVKPRTFLGIDMSVIGKLLKSVLAVAIVECIALSYPAIDRYLAAAYLGEGQISALRYATFLIMLPAGMFVVSSAAAFFPWISDLTVPGSTKKLLKLYSDSIRLVVFTMGLVAIGVFVFAGDLVRIAFQRGAFDAQSLSLTTGPLIYFSFGIVFFSVYMIQMRFYYARSARVRLGIILILMLAVKIAFSLLLIESMEQNGLALATSLAWICGCFIMTFDLKHSLGLPLRQFSISILIKIVLSLISVVLLWIFLIKLWPDNQTGTLLISLVRIILLGSVGLILYIGMATVFRLPEPKRVIEMIRSKLTAQT